tara:strand:+ start:400 stop:504 length:105 start_codon:yes stop_codon:yes gene_type:complete
MILGLFEELGQYIQNNTKKILLKEFMMPLIPMMK